MADITITEGDTLEVDYSLENTGDGTGTFDPRLLVQGVQEDQDTGITLDPTQTATGTLQWPTENGDAVTDALAEAVTDDTSDSILVTVMANIVDDFEAALYDDLNNTLSDYYTGTLSNFQRQQTTVNSDTYALEATADGSIGSTSGLGSYPQEGDTFECYTNIVGDDDSGIAWGTDGPVQSGDGYEIDIDTRNALAIRKWSGGSQAALVSSSPTIPSGEWLRAEIDWATDGTMTVILEDSTGAEIDTLTTQDNDYEANTGISFRNGGAGANSVFWDDYGLI